MWDSDSHYNRWRNCLCKSQKLVRYFDKKAQRDTGARTFRELFVGLGRKMFMGLGLTDLKNVGLGQRAETCGVY